MMGRPRNKTLDRAVLDVTAEVLQTRGYGAVNIDAVAKAAGTTRATVYRRHGTVAELVVAVLADRFGLDPGVDTGSFEGDLRAIQLHRLALFTHPLLVGALPGLIDDLSRHPEAAEVFSQEFLGPRRAATDRAVDRAVARGELRPGLDCEWLSDLLTGPLLMRAILPGLDPVDEGVVNRSVDAALQAARSYAGTFATPSGSSRRPSTFSE